MGYVLLWLEGQVTALLWVALVLVLRGRIQRRWLERLLIGGGVSIVALISAATVAMSIFLRVRWQVPNDWLIYSASWMVVFIAGIVVLVRAQKDSWPAKRVAIIFCAGLALTCTTYWNIDTAVRLKMAAVRHEATAMLASIEPPSVPDRVNAALVYEQAFAALSRLSEAEHKKAPAVNRSKSDKTDAWQQRFNQTDYPAKDPEFIAYMTERQAIVETIRRASAMPDCTFDRDFRGLEMVSRLMPEQSKMRECARLLAADARYKAANGKIGEGFEDIAAIHRMAEHLGAQPVLISGLVAYSLDAIASSALEGILTTSTPTAADLAPLMKGEGVLYDRLLYRVMKGEEAFGLATFADLADELITTDVFEVVQSEQTRDPRFFGTSLWRVFLAPDDIASYRHFMQAMREEVAQNTEGRYVSKRSLKDGLAKSKELEEKFTHGPSGILTRMCAPAFQRSIENFARSEARQRLGRLAVAIAAFRAKNKKLPEKLEELTPEFIAAIPLDPFDEKPLRFKKSGEAIVIYSVNSSLDDDGIVEFKVPKKAEQASAKKIVFRVGGE